MLVRLSASLAVLAFSITLLTSGCGDRQNQSQDKPSPAPAASTPPPAPMESKPMAARGEVLSFMKKALYPEGIDYDAANNKYLVTSLREGVVGSVAPDGSYSVFAQDANMVSAIGIRIDAAHDRFIVCNSDPGASVHTKPETQKKLAGLAVFRLSTGKLMKYVDLGKLAEGSHFCNDLAIDDTGNVYVTDSFSPIIYKVDMGFNASILLNNDRFIGEGFNLNGIVYKDGYLLVTKYNEGILFKVPVKEPEKFTQVTIKETFPGADGLLWGPDGSLIVIANLSTNKVFKLSSQDNWASAEVVNSMVTGQVFATTGVLRDGSAHVLHAMLHVLFDPNTTDHVEKFVIGDYKL